MLKKALMISSFFIIFIVIAIIGMFNAQQEQIAAILGKHKEEQEALGNTCEYLSEDVEFVLDTESKRSYVKDHVNKYYVNAVLAIYEMDNTVDIDDIISKINELNKQGYDLEKMLQIYKYGEVYNTYLEDINEVHSLSTSRKYFNDKYEYKETDKKAYAFFIEVLKKINTECDVIVSASDWIPPLAFPFIISSDYQDANYGQLQGRVHYGVDTIKSDNTTYGAPLYAVTDAVVNESGSLCPPNDGYLGNNCNGGKGNYVVLLTKDENDKDLYIINMHMKDVSVEKDDVVTVGQQIGTVGHSGNSTGAHVHLEIRNTKVWGSEGNGAINPHKFIDYYNESEVANE